MSGRKSGGSKLDRFISTHKPHEAEIMAAQADGVMSTAESTLLGADFCPSVAASQYTAGTTEMDDYNKSFLEKVAAGARQESIQHKRVETPTIDEDDEEDQEPGALSSPNNRSDVPHGGSTNYGSAHASSAAEQQGPDDEVDESGAAGDEDANEGSKSGKGSQPDFFDKAAKMFELVLDKLTEKLKQCYDGAGAAVDDSSR